MPNNVAVIGGGASGLTAAISAAQNGAEVTVLEGCSRVGRKILATGNGRCNFTNVNADVKNYHGEHPSFILGVKKRFWVEETIDFFEGLGVLARTEEDGRVYPYSEQASSVLDVLRFRADGLGINTVCSFEVKTVLKKNNRFSIISFDGRCVEADKVIAATGGKAAPDLGSKGGGYEIMRSLGHTVTKLKPSLVQIKTETDIVRKLRGIHVNARVTLGGISEYGEVLFTDYGLSGIAVFSLSAYLSGEDVIILDLMPEFDTDGLQEMLWMRVASNPNITLENFFTGMLNKRVGAAIMKSAGAEPLSRKAVTLGEKEILRLCTTIKDWRFKVTGTMSWNNAQTTRGGVSTAEFDASTMQSRIVDGLYACGELLDIDGDCGGFNLQWAWSSGYIAGQNAAKE